jgi:hypothetical protein
VKEKREHQDRECNDLDISFKIYIKDEKYQESK